MLSSSAQKEIVGQEKIKTSRYLWTVLFLIFAAATAQCLVEQGLPVLYPFIQMEFGLSHTSVGLITSFYATGVAVVLIPTSWLADSLGVKRMIATSLLGMAVLTLAFPLANSFPIILALAALIGVAGAVLYPATTLAVMEWAPLRVRALAMGFKQTGMPIAGALVAATLPALALAAGWRMAAAATGLPILAIVIVFIWLYRDAPRNREAAGKLDFVTVRNILRNRPLITTIAWAAAFIGLQYVTLSYFMLFLIEELRLSPIMAGGLLAIANISSGIGRLLWGACSDFLFHGRRTQVLAITGFLTVAWLLGFSLVGIGTPNITLILLVILMGMSTLSFHGVLATSLGELADSKVIATTVGLASTAMRTSSIVMTPLFGYLLDMSESYSLAWRAGAAVALVSTLALVVFRQEQRH